MSGHIKRRQHNWLINRGLLADMNKLITLDLPKGFSLQGELEIIEERDSRTLVKFRDPAVKEKWDHLTNFHIAQGQAAEPILYRPLYHITSDASLPRSPSIVRLTDTGLVFDEVKPSSGEVVFLPIDSLGSMVSVPIKHYASGVTYDKKGLLELREYWKKAVDDAKLGAAWHSLLNHVHFYPFLNMQYPETRIVKPLLQGEGRVEHILHTLSWAIERAVLQSIGKDRIQHHFVILVSNLDLPDVEKALLQIPEEGYVMTSTHITAIIEAVIGYSGWQNTLGSKRVSYPGVKPGEAYVISVDQNEFNHKSFQKLALSPTIVNGDKDLMVLEEAVYDSFFGIYCDPLTSTSKVMLPE